MEWKWHMEEVLKALTVRPCFILVYKWANEMQGRTNKSYYRITTKYASMLQDMPQSFNICLNPTRSATILQDLP